MRSGPLADDELRPVEDVGLGVPVSVERRGQPDLAVADITSELSNI